MAEHHTRQGHHTASGPHPARTGGGQAPDAISRDLARGFYAGALEDWDRYRALVPNSCWCGGAGCGPDDTGRITWPGRAEGAPHPR